MDWIEWMWKVDVESGKWIVARFRISHMSPQLPEPGTDEPSKQLLRYITYINSITSDHSLSELTKLYYDFSVLQSLFDRLFSCIPASSAPVKRVFSQSGVIMTARRERISNAVLESPVFLKCNADI